jgi:hypothetical protein
MDGVPVSGRLPCVYHGHVPQSVQQMNAEYTGMRRDGQALITAASTGRESKVIAGGQRWSQDVTLISVFRMTTPAGR